MIIAGKYFNRDIISTDPTIFTLKKKEWIHATICEAKPVRDLAAMQAEASDGYSLTFQAGCVAINLKSIVNERARTPESAT